MNRFENRAEKAMRAKHKALRCAETRPESPTQEVTGAYRRYVAGAC